MSHVKPVIALVMIVAAWVMASGAGAQVTAEAIQWGEPVEGVQLRLALAAGLPPPPPSPGGTPALEVQIRNQGLTTVKVDGGKIIFPEIEIDDVWYGQAYAVSAPYPPIAIAPGLQSNAVRTGHNVFNMSAANSPPVRQFEYRPGSHRVRVRSEATTAAGKRLTLVSNRITINIPDAFAYGAAGDRLALGIWNEAPQYHFDERINAWITLRNNTGGAVPTINPLLRESWLYITTPAGGVSKVEVGVPRGSGAGDFSLDLSGILYRAIRQPGTYIVQWKAGPVKPKETSGGSPAHQLESGIVTFKVLPQ